MKRFLYVATIVGVAIVATSCGSEKPDGMVFADAPESVYTTVSEPASTTTSEPACTTVFEHTTESTTTTTHQTEITKPEVSETMVSEVTTVKPESSKVTVSETSEAHTTTTYATTYTTTTTEATTTEIEIPFVSADAMRIFEVDGKTWDIGDFYDGEDAFLYSLKLKGIDYILADSSVLTAEMLENRNGKIIVERAIGWVTDLETGAGKILNTDEGYYISYEDVNYPHTYPMPIVSYFMYNPDNNYVDDIILRYDLPLGDIVEEVVEN